MQTITVQFFAPDEPRVPITLPTRNLLEHVRELCKGDIDIGLTPHGHQYAVYEWSLVDGSPANPGATEFVGRPVCGPCVVWGVGLDGESVSLEVDS